MANFNGQKCNSLEEFNSRFWSKIHIRKPDECWLWKAYKNPQGYGIVGYKDKLVRAHRLAFMIHYKCEIPYGKLVLHKCDNPPCCNPLHLYIGTHSDNMNDMFSRNRWKSTGKNVFGMTKFYAKDLYEIRSLKGKLSQRAIAKKFKVHQSTISHILTSNKYPCRDGYFA